MAEFEPCGYVLREIGRGITDAPFRRIICGKRAAKGGRCYRHSGRTITTVDKLKNYPPGTVVRDSEGEFYCRDPYMGRRETWFPAWVSRPFEMDFGVAPDDVVLPAFAVWIEGIDSA